MPDCIVYNRKNIINTLLYNFKNTYLIIQNILKYSIIQKEIYYYTKEILYYESNLSNTLL